MAHASPHVRPAARKTTRRRGLSSLELIIGLAITGVIALALAGFTTSVAAGWRHGGDEAKRRSMTSRAGQQMATAMGGMLAVVQAKPGGAAGEATHVFFWQRDTYTATPDGQAQFGEMALLEYDPATKGIYLYEVKPAHRTKPPQEEDEEDEGPPPISAHTAWPGSDPRVVDYFKRPDVGLVLPRRLILGGTPSTGGVEVTSARFDHFAAHAAKPVVTFQLGLNDAGRTGASFGNVALRAAKTPKNLD